MDWGSVVICVQVFDFFMLVDVGKPSLFYFLFVELVDNFFVGINFHLLDLFLLLIHYPLLFLLLFLLLLDLLLGQLLLLSGSELNLSPIFVNIFGKLILILNHGKHNLNLRFHEGNGVGLNVENLRNLFN